MNDREKQIEEMANDLKQIKFNMQGCFTPQYVGVHEDITAKDLYELNYRKIPEGSMVLSKEEYESVQKLFTYDKPMLDRIDNFSKEIKDQSRKQAVKEFLEKGLNALANIELRAKTNEKTATIRIEDIIEQGNRLLHELVPNELKELAKEFGVEL